MRGGCLGGRHVGEVVAAVGVERAVEYAGHQRDHLVAAVRLAEEQPPARRRDRGARPPLQPQPLHQGLRAHPSDRRQPLLDDPPALRPLPPVRRHEPDVLRWGTTGRDDGAERGLQQRDPIVDGAVLDVEDVEEFGVRVAPPGGSRYELIAAQRHPHPLRAPPPGVEVVGQLVVERVRQPAEQVKLVASRDRAHDQIHPLTLSRLPTRQPPVLGSVLHVLYLILNGRSDIGPFGST